MLYTPISLENNTFLLTECKGHTRDIGPRLWQCGPSTARFVQKRPGENIPQYGWSKRVSSLLNAHGPNFFILNLWLFRSKIHGCQ